MQSDRITLLSLIVPVLAVFVPVALMVIGGYLATRSARPENQS